MYPIYNERDAKRINNNLVDSQHYAHKFEFPHTSEYCGCRKRKKLLRER